MSKPYWIELRDRPAPTHADVLDELQRHKTTVEDILWEPEGRPSAPSFRIEVTFIGAGEER